MGAKCTHHDITHVMTFDQCQVWAGNERQVLPHAGSFEILISLLGTVRAKGTKFHLSRGSRRVFSALAAYQQQRNNILCVDWPDMQAPDLDRAFWEALVHDLRNMKGRAVIYCMGGHGRTGTALCALATVGQYAPALESGDVIRWVRENYCQDAVETDSQVRYLERTIKAVTRSKSSRESGYFGRPRGDQQDRSFSSGPQTRLSQYLGNPDLKGLDSEFED